MRVADYIAQGLVSAGVVRGFMVTGGGAMHLNDAFARSPDLKMMCMHHEQACAMAAEGYARLGGQAALVNVTTGPGGINALNGVFGAFTDSVPMIVVSGQVKRETIASVNQPKLRQLGDQEADIVAMVRPITKWATLLADPNDARYILEKAIWTMRTGRPGPVWIDVPVDVQGAKIDLTAQRGFDPRLEDYSADGASSVNEIGALRGDALSAKVAELLKLLAKAERPVILPGTGIRSAQAAKKFLVLAERLGIPVATGFNAHDLVPETNAVYAGKSGTVGDRAGNFAVQNSDLVLILGCRLNIRQISYNYQGFARSATKVMVDIDKEELAKPTLSIDVPIHADLTEFLDILEVQTQSYKVPSRHAWYLNWCQQRVARYPTVLPEYYETSSPVNPYAFCDVMWDELAEGDVVVTANATACIVTFQTAKLKPHQRLFSNSGSASMGYDLPAAIGACIAADRRVICMAGDGSIMQNIQELATIVGHNLPIKIVLLCNNGYHSILQTQKAFFSDNLYGCGPENGVFFPDFDKVIDAFGLPRVNCEFIQDARKAIRAMLDTDGPAVCSVTLDPAQPFAPKLSSRRLDDGTMVSSPLEDMAPFLPRDELAENMLVPSQ